MIDAGLDQPEAQSGCPIATVYTRESIEELFDGLFRIVFAEQTHIFPYVVDEYLRYEYELQPWFAAMPQRLGWHYLIVGKPI